jgi:hypothetical protein
VVGANPDQSNAAEYPAGDAIFGSGKGGPKVPAWLDITQAAITDSGDSILFTLTVKEPIPVLPAWENADDGGQFWWSRRLIGDIADLTFVSSGCLQSQGADVPAVYCLDLIWNVQTASFRARPLDDTTCTEKSVPLSFSPDRTQVIFLVSKSLFTNAALIPNPDSFEYLTETFVWKASSNGNKSLTIVDDAPSQSGGGFVLGTWSSSSKTACGCPQDPKSGKTDQGCPA